MFNFQNLNDYEFELLCKDILEAELKIRLRGYAKGRDGGIDISCFSSIAGNAVIIAQVKHYINSTYSSLLATLKRELEKVKLLNPQNYYICTSLRLTHANIREIYHLFRAYMSSPENVYDGSIIDDLLSRDANISIVNRHYKLWLTSSNIIELINNRNVFIDTDELMLGIEREIRLFIETTAYYNARKLIDKNNLLILLGGPGVGKTTISKMLLLYYSKKGYSVRYVSDNCLRDIKKVLVRDESQKEIILMDDFLGQHYLNLKEDQPSQIRTLITHILRHRNKKMILNSRITIFNEALMKNPQLNNFLADNHIGSYELELDDVPVFERAKIFYNHIYFNDLPADYFNSIKKDCRYINIAKHRNYNPRIIEYVTKKRNFQKCKAGEYYQFIINALTNPTSVWEDEFYNRMDTFDRVFMHTLYSLTDTFIEKELFRTCFDKRIKHESGYDSTRDMFSECLTRLTRSLVRIVKDREVKIGVINPSLNDYILYNLEHNENEIDCMLDHALYVEQLNRISNLDREKAERAKLIKTQNGTFFEMKTMGEAIEYHYLQFVYSTGYRDPGIQSRVVEIISNSATYLNNSRDNASKLLCAIFSDNDFFEFYSLNHLLFDFDKMKAVFDQLSSPEDVNTFLSIYQKYYDENAMDNEWIMYLESTMVGFTERIICER